MKPNHLYCPRCGENKSEEEFYVNKSRATGRNFACKVCVNAYNKMRRESTKMKRAGKGPFVNTLKQEVSEKELEKFDIEKEAFVNGKLKHFTGLFVAQSESGKTTLMMYLLNRIKKYYDIVILITKNLQAEAYDLTEFDFVTNEEHLQHVIYAMRLFQRKTMNYFNVLLIIDDIKTRSKAVIQDLYTNGRNSNFTTWTLVQHPTMVDNHMRTNCKFIFLFHQKNPELISVTTKYFLKNFVKTPREIRTKIDKEEYLENWLQRNTENYTSVVLNIKEGVVQTVKASQIDK